MYVYLLFLFFVYFALSPRHTTTRNTTWCERRGSHVGSLFFSIFLSHYVYHYMYTYYIALSFYLSLVSLLSNVNFFLPTSSCFPLSLSLSLYPPIPAPLRIFRTSFQKPQRARLLLFSSSSFIYPIPINIDEFSLELSYLNREEVCVLLHFFFRFLFVKKRFFDYISMGRKG